MATDSDNAQRVPTTMFCRRIGPSCHTLTSGRSITLAPCILLGLSHAGMANEAVPSLMQVMVAAVSPTTHVNVTNTAYFALACIVYHWHFHLETARQLVADEAPPSSHAGWMLQVALRNVALTMAVYSAWHYLLYQRQPPLSTDKVYPKMPPASQHVRDRKWTLVGACIGSMFEILLVFLWASEKVPLDERFLSARGVVLVIASAAWADLHFYVVHRAMHPWHIGGAADPGAFLYRRFHSQHHKSFNPGPWSGLAMHPVEHLIYFSRSLWPLLIATHPTTLLFTNLRAILGPAPGHHGFRDKLGSNFHIQHHLHSECNYSTRGMWDKYFGTYREA